MKKHITKIALGFGLALMPLFASATASSTMPVPVHVSPANDSALTSSSFTSVDWSDTVMGSTSLLYYFEMSHMSSTTVDGNFVAPVATSSLLSSSTYPTVGTADGVYYWHVQTADTLGNVSAWSLPWKVTVDSVAPTAPGALTLASSVPPVISGSSTTNGVQFWTFLPSTDSGSGVAKYQYNLNGTSTWTDNGLATSFTTTLGVGSYLLSVRALDVVGNVSTTTAVSFTVTASSTTSTSTPVTTPGTAQQCKKGGWRSFTDPVFKNQGKCVSFVEKMLRDKKKEAQRLRQEAKKQEENNKKFIKKYEEERRKGVEKAFSHGRSQGSVGVTTTAFTNVTAGQNVGSGNSNHSDRENENRGGQNSQGQGKGNSGNNGNHGKGR